MKLVKMVLCALMTSAGIATAQVPVVLNAGVAWEVPTEGQYVNRSLKVTRLPLFHPIGNFGSFVVRQGTIKLTYLGRVEGGSLYYEAVFSGDIQVGAYNVLVDDVGNVIWRR